MSDIRLNDEHELQVQAYLRFAKLKRDQHVRETLMVIRDFKDANLHPGEMYNYKELCKLFQDMEAEVQTLVDKEIQHAYHTNALLVKVLLNQAQASGLELHVDTNTLENEFLLRTIANSESQALSRPASDFVRRNAQLSKLGTVSTITVTDTAGTQKQKQLEEELASAKERLTKLQEQTTTQLRDQSALKQQLQLLQDELAVKNDALLKAQMENTMAVAKLQGDFASLSTEAAGAASTSQSQFKALQRQLEEHRAQLQDARVSLADAQQQVSLKEGELRQLKDVLDGKLQEAPQVRQMRTIMQEKSNQVADLRRRLAKYEPQAIPSADN